MARTKTVYTVVVCSDGALGAHENLTLDLAMELLANLATNANVQSLLFKGSPIPFSVSTAPTVTIGAKKERKPRSKPEAVTKPRKEKDAGKNGTQTGAVTA